jgi:hypothetical protein
MICAWSATAFQSPAPRFLIVGTDPILSVLIAIPWKLLRPRTKVLHWCFDVYPDAAIADRTLAPTGPAARLARALVRAAYRRCDAIVDIGPCMGELLSTHYRSPASRLTLTPWALLEPPSPLKIDLAERSAIFGDARLALMYSGNFGRAHSYTEIVDLAARLSDSSVRIAFSIRGNRAADLEQANIKIVPFAAEDQLAARLSAPDIHIVTLREEWTGTVVPSKFFGALAAGRPVLFIGSQHSSIAMWIRQYQVGWVLGPETATELQALEPAQLTRLFHHCHNVYHQHFSKEKAITAFHNQLSYLH